MMNDAKYVCFQHSRSGKGNFLIRKDAVINDLTSSITPKEAMSLYVHPQSSSANIEDAQQVQKISILNPGLLAELETILQLFFLPKGESEGNVCMAGSEEIRDDFKATFTYKDLENYIVACLYSGDYRKQGKASEQIQISYVPLPINADEFWEKAKTSSGINKLQ